MNAYAQWPTLMYEFEWDQHAAHKDQLNRICHELEDKKYNSIVAPDAKRGLYESGFGFVTVDDPSVQAWREWVEGCFFKAAAAANKEYWPVGAGIDIDIHESWCHITRDGGYHDTHIHPNSSWSCIYYLDIGDSDVDSRNGINRFYNPTYNMYLDAGTAWMSACNTVDVMPRAGMLFVFPSYIPHSALRYQGDKERVILSCNCRIKWAEQSA